MGATYHAISHNNNEFIIEKHNSLPLRGFTLSFDVNKKCSLGLNPGLINRLSTSLSTAFVLFFEVSLILMIMQMR